MDAAERNSMKLKIIDVNGKTYAEIIDGKPAYLHDDGREVGFDAPATVATISRLNGEAKAHREAKEAAEGKLRSFEGITDADAARRAIDTVKNLDQGQLVTAGKVEEIKAAAKRAAEDQVIAAAKASNEAIAALTRERDEFKAGLYGEKIGNAFSRSKFIAEKVAVPTDMLQSMFGSRFKVDNGKIVGVGADNQPIYSRSRAGEIADFDEAIESMVEGYSHRDTILKGTGSSGAGSRHGNGSSSSSKTITRAQYDKDPVGSAAKFKDGYTLVD